ncbi:MAG: hypothetical protein EOM62_20950 [Bacteroidia bacterium]|nr:hypothetical protein [Bacteroidia bacterium]
MRKTYRVTFDIENADDDLTPNEIDREVFRMGTEVGWSIRDTHTVIVPSCGEGTKFIVDDVLVSPTIR